MKLARSVGKRTEIRSVLAACRGKNILLLTHENADLDAICSARMFQLFLKKNRIVSVIAAPHHINDRAQHFCFNEGVSFQVNPNLSEFGVIILFDLNSIEQLGHLGKEFSELKKERYFELFVFDHHVLESSSILRGEGAFINDGCVSTTQLIANLLDKSLSGEMNFLNCLGIIEDTGHFVTGDADSFDSFAHSFRSCGRPFADVLAYAKHNVPDDERIAFLKAAQRAQIQKIGKSQAILVTSNLSFYQSAAASKLLSFGADITLVAGKEKGGVTTLSGRVAGDFKSLHKFNLVRHLLLPLQEEFGGSCGGHSGAALWKGSADPNKILASAVEILKKKL